MTAKIKSSNNQRGVSLIAAIFIIVLLAFMGVMFVFQGLQNAFLPTGDINPLPTALTTWSLATTFPAGDNIVIKRSQYWNAAAVNRNITVDQLVSATVTSSNITPIYLGVANQVDGYCTGLLLYDQNASANPTYNWQSQANGATVRANTNMVAVHLNSAGAVVDFGWQ